MRRFKDRLSSVNSTQDDIPAEMVSPAAPQRASTPSKCGNGNAQRIPRIVVKTTRITAKRSGVRVSRSA
jgi:hypothetical protein